MSAFIVFGSKIAIIGLLLQREQGKNKNKHFIITNFGEKFSG